MLFIVAKNTFRILPHKATDADKSPLSRVKITVNISQNIYLQQYVHVNHTMCNVYHFIAFILYTVNTPSAGPCHQSQAFQFITKMPKLVGRKILNFDVAIFLLSIFSVHVRFLTNFRLLCCITNISFSLHHCRRNTVNVYRGYVCMYKFPLARPKQFVLLNGF